MERIAMTGAAGLIGGILAENLKNIYDLYYLDKISQSLVDHQDIKDSSQYVQMDISTRLEDLASLFKNVDVVIHLAADRRVEASWESVLHNNIKGTYTVFEASRRARVKRIIFASSNHVTGGFELESPYIYIVNGEYDKVKSPYPLITTDSPIRSDSFYGDSKVFGEQYGWRLSKDGDMSVICLRIGTVNASNRPEVIRHFATLLTYRDLVQLVVKSLSAPGNIGYLVVYGVSNNTWRFWDITNSQMILGYKPADNAEKFRIERP